MRVFLNTALSEYKGDMKTIAAIISLYHRLIDVNPGPKFSEIIIYWNQDATNIDFSKLKNYSFQDLKKDFEARKQVFHFEGDKCISFEKGLWQNYLLNIYASTINFSDFDGGNNRLGQSNPHLKIPKIIEDLS